MTIKSDALYNHLLCDLAPFLPDVKKLTPVKGILKEDLTIEDDEEPFEALMWYLTPKQASSYLLKRDFLTKLVEKVEPEADGRALDKFLSTNEQCSRWTLDESREQWIDQYLGEIRKSISEFWSGPTGLHPLVTTVNDLFEEATVGPGAAVGARPGNDFYTKLFSGPLTTSKSHLYPWYSAIIQRYPIWSSAERNRIEAWGYPQMVSGNRAFFVEKRHDISRLAAKEPVLENFFQMGLGNRVARRLKSFFGIDLSTQQHVNRELARRGSISGGFATIDLSSASDSISLKMLRYILPGDFLWYLMALRSEKMSIPGRDNESVDLHMVSTMGNGFTFPLQTMLFSAVVVACARVHGIKLVKSPRRLEGLAKSRVNWGVYGDDIIVPTELVDPVLKLLDILGFRVNQAKTFVKGPFRESCGGDFYRGVNVRPVFIKNIRSMQDRYVAINLLNCWSARTGISLPSTIGYLIRSVRYNPVPSYENVDAGIQLPLSMINHLKRDKCTGSIRYTAYRTNPSKVIIGEGLFLRERARLKRTYNPDGLLLSFIAGHIVGSTLTPRQGVSRYWTRSQISPYWDYLDPASIVGMLDWQRWETAVYFNLNS